MHKKNRRTIKKLPNYKKTTELYTRPLQYQIANKSFYHNSKHIVIQQSVYEVFSTTFNNITQ